MNYKVTKRGLIDVLTGWDGFLKKKVHLIACGGTAMTLLGIKESTKDIDFVVPSEGEHDYLVKILQQLGYKSASGHGWAKDDGFMFDLFSGKRVHTTELLESPLIEGNHLLVKEFEYIYLGVLNFYDLIISKLFRSSSVDIADCLDLVSLKSNEIDMLHLIKRFRKTASFDITEQKVNSNLENFLRVLKKKGFNYE